MSRKEVYDSLGGDLAKGFAIGAFIFNEETDRGKKVMTVETAREYKTEALEAVIVFLTYDDELDFEADYIPLETAMNVSSVLDERRKENTNSI